MIHIDNLSKSFGGQALFEDASFNIAPGDKIGLIGRNGHGKSTLFRIVLGQDHPDSGEVSIPKNYSIGNLEQHISFTQKTLIDEVGQALPEEAIYDIYKAEKILFGLGFSLEDLQKAPNLFSGGYQVRIQLAKVLVREPNLLLLDEPTNYLDIVSLQWLKNFLLKYPKEFMIITHDRGFMNQVITHTVGIHRGKLRKIKGGTAKYAAQIAQEETVYEETRQNEDRKRKEMERFVARFKAKASKASLAQSRMKMLEKMETKEKLEEILTLDFKFPYKDCPAKNLMSVSNLSFGFNPDELLIDGVDFELKKGEVLGIIGKNGKGKSTLLNLLAGCLTPLQGEISLHNSVGIGHFGQTNIERLRPDNTIEQEIGSVSPNLTTTRIRIICGTMMFTGDLAHKKIRILSGGERSRVMLGKILAQESNILLLDEPTNHLDQESVEVLKEELKKFPGGVIIVTHSESLLTELATRLLVFQEDPVSKKKVFSFNGGYSEFLEKVGFTEIYDPKPTPKVEEIIDLGSSDKDLSKQLKKLKKDYQSLEGEILKKEETLEQLNHDFLEEMNVSNSPKLAQIQRDLAQVQKQLDTMLESLDALTEKISTIESKI